VGGEQSWRFPLTASDPSRRTRIVLYALPPLVHDLIKDRVARRPDMVVVGEPGQEADLLRTMAETRPHLILTAVTRGALPAACDRLIRTLSELQLLGVRRDGSGGLLWELTPHSTTLEEQAVATLLGPPEWPDTQGPA
jgi:hypothetical protein